MRHGRVTGQIRPNGQELPPEFRRETGFVDQFDIHVETATVREALYFSASLRRSRIDGIGNIAGETLELLEISEIENVVISSLGLEEKKVR